MKSIKIILLIFVVAILTNCGASSSTEEEVFTHRETPKAETDQSKRVELTNFSKEDVARYTISLLMGQPSQIMKVRNENDLYYVSYVRQSDSKKFDYKIQINGNEIIWATAGGRWRTSVDDERLSFEEAGNKLKITQIYSDGSVDIKEYQKGE